MNESNNTILSIQENIEAALTYSLGFLTGIIFLIIEDNKFVKFHAIQSTGTFISLFILNAFINTLYVIPYIGWLISLLIALLTIAEFALWIFLMHKAYNNEKFKLPIIGDIAEKNSMWGKYNMIELFHEETCKACSGKGIQHNTQIGLNVLCLVCLGKGKRQVSNMEGLPPGNYCCSNFYSTAGNKIGGIAEKNSI